MPATRPPEPGGEWLPSGFPPRSFPPGRAVTHPEAPIAGTRPRPGRGWWLAAAAALVAALLLIAGIVVARRGGDDDGVSNLASGSSTTTGEVSIPVSEETTTTPAPPPSIEPVSTTIASVTTTSPPNPPPDASAGVLEPSVTTLALPKTDTSAGASRASFALRNSGARPLTFTAQSTSPGLTAAPARGTLGPGATVSLTVTLDGARIPTEGPYLGVVSLGGTGGSKTVQVQAVVGRPPEFTDNVGEACPVPTTGCSRQIKLAPTSDPDATPCTTPWLYSITITDQSRIQSAQAIARAGPANADAPLQRGGSSDIFQSVAFNPIPAGTVLRFSIEAVDELGFARRLAEQTIAC